MAGSRGGCSREKPILILDDDDDDENRVLLHTPRPHVHRPFRRAENTISSNTPIINLTDDDSQSREVVEAQSANAWTEAQKRLNRRQRQSDVTRSRPVIRQPVAPQHEPTRAKENEAASEVQPPRLPSTAQPSTIPCTPSEPPVEAVSINAPLENGPNRTRENVTSNPTSVPYRSSAKEASYVDSSSSSAPAKVYGHGQITTQINERQRARKTVGARGDTSIARSRLKRKDQLTRQPGLLPDTDKEPRASPNRIPDPRQSPARNSAQPAPKTVPDKSGQESSTVTVNPHTAKETACAMDPKHNQNEPDQRALSTQRLTIPTNDFESAHSTVRGCLRRHLSKRYETQAYATSSMMWRQRTCQESAARTQKEWYGLANSHVQRVSPFAHMPALSVPFDKQSHNEGFREITEEIFTGARPKDAVVTSSWAIHPTTYTCNTVTVPPFREYISLHTNLLADNESKLLATPYFKDETDEGRHKLLEELPLHYEMKHDAKGPLDLRNEQCRFYKQSIEAFLTEVGISWTHILYWLFAPDHCIKRINDTVAGSRQFEACLLTRSRYNVEEFERDGEKKTTTLFTRDGKKFKDFFSELEPITVQEMRLSAIVCEAVFEECNFSIWYLIKQSDLIQNYVRRKTKTATAGPRTSYRQVVCRVCHQ